MDDNEAAGSLSRPDPFFILAASLVLVFSFLRRRIFLPWSLHYAYAQPSEVPLYQRLHTARGPMLGTLKFSGSESKKENRSLEIQIIGIVYFNLFLANYIRD